MALVAPTITDGSSGTSSTINAPMSNYTAGQQGAGNIYPAGIQGTQADNAGTALGTVQNNSLVANQLSGLLASNSPYIQQAQQAGINTANSRGLLNSSIAAGNSEAGAIQAALPIATSDATTNANLQTTNLNNLSKTQTADIGAQAQVESASAGAAGQIASATLNNQGALQRQREDLAYTGQQTGLQDAFTSGLTQQQYQNQLGLGQQSYLNQYGLNNQTAATNSGLSSQGYQQNYSLGMENIAGSYLNGQQSLANNVAIAGISNPGLISDPTAAAGYVNYFNGLGGTSIDSFLDQALGGYYNG